MRPLSTLPRLLLTSTAAFAALAAPLAPAAFAEATTDITPVDPTAQPLDIQDLTLDRPAISPDGNGQGDDVAVSFGIGADSSPVDVRVVDAATGATVTTLTTVEPVAAFARVAWNGTDATGAAVPDGEYRIELAPSGAAWAAPAGANTTYATVRVDRTAPRLRVTKRAVRLASRRAGTVRIPFTLTEPATVRVTATGAIGTSRRAGIRRAGRSQLLVPITRASRARGAIAGRRGGRVLLRFVASDAAGNRTTGRIAVRVLPPLPLKLSWPINSAVSSGFGRRWGRPHQGIDLVASPGTPIHAAADGRVIKAGWESGFGQLVVIDHGDGIETWYAHQSHIRVHVGEQVRRGELIGLSGATGHVTGPHLHFEVHRGGSPINPLQMLG